jgi:hypothetical protein
MTLKWFSPKHAQNLIEFALNHKLLIKKQDLLTPNFNYKEVKIPVGFRPSIKTLIEKNESINKKESVLHKIILILSNKTNLNYEDIKNRINKVKNEKNIIPEIAALLVCKEYDIGISEYYNDIKETIFNENCME